MITYLPGFRSKKSKGQQGFTLVELLVIIGIIGIIFAVILIAVNPPKRLKQSRDAVRRQDVRTILSAVLLFIVDNDGDLPTGIDSTVSTVQILGTAGVSGCSGAIGANCADINTEDDCLDMTSDLVDEYVAAIPKDPKTGTDGITDYYLNKTANGRIEIGACDPEIASVIRAKR